MALPLASLGVAKAYGHGDIYRLLLGSEARPDDDVE
jgi:hypothetical protein